MKNEFSLNTIGYISLAISNYLELHGCIPQLDPSQIHSLNLIQEKILSFSKDKKYIDYVSYSYWNKFDVHIVNQTWGSTAGGWPGMGGATMTDSYTIIIENKFIGYSFIYYGSTLAYIVKIDEVYLNIKLNHLPGIYNLSKSELTVNYINKK